eukprot:1140635-Pelagomonas_calceolata.AAC.1
MPVQQSYVMTTLGCSSMRDRTACMQTEARASFQVGAPGRVLERVGAVVCAKRRLNCKRTE